MSGGVSGTKKLRWSKKRRALWASINAEFGIPLPLKYEHPPSRYWILRSWMRGGAPQYIRFTEWEQKWVDGRRVVTDGRQPPLPPLAIQAPDATKFLLALDDAGKSQIGSRDSWDTGAVA